MKDMPKPDEGIDLTHAFAETRTVFADDLRLRRYGFVIHSRPARGPTTWTREGRVYTQSAALALCNKMVKEVANA